MSTARRVEYIALQDIPRVEPDDDLALLIRQSLGRSGLQVESGDVFVIAQKVVSKAEGRYVRLADVEPSPQAIELAAQIGKDARFVEVVLREAEEVVRVGPNVLIVAHRLGFVMANAGIDQSNVEQWDGDERVLLLPKDPDVAAQGIKSALEHGRRLNIGIIINDSFGRPWRNGVVGVAIGAAGVPSLVSQIGVPDMFGRAMRVTEIAIADEIASAGSLLMGQAGQGLPVVLVRGLSFSHLASSASVLARAKSRDLFR